MNRFYAYHIRMNICIAWYFREILIGTRTYKEKLPLKFSSEIMVSQRPRNFDKTHQDS